MIVIYGTCSTVHSIISFLIIRAPVHLQAAFQSSRSAPMAVPEKYRSPQYKISSSRTDHQKRPRSPRSYLDISGRPCIHAPDCPSGAPDQVSSSALDRPAGAPTTIYRTRYAVIQACMPRPKRKAPLVITLEGQLPPLYPPLLPPLTVRL